MPQLTGVAVLDFFLVIGALGLAAAGAFGSVMKFIDLFKPSTPAPAEGEGFGRRAEDLGTLDKRVALVEQEQEFTKERHEELRGEVRQNRTEQRQANTLLFEKLDDITAIVRKD